jgi:hypothetical protein
MTMQNVSHPDDERLAAYAGGDRDAVADPSLSAHISSCDRCAPMVDELAGLRTALAELPDLLPSRPLRLIPSVPPAPTPRSTPLGWLRRLAGPAMAAGAGLVLIGAIGVGASGGAGDLFGVREALSNLGNDAQGAGAAATEEGATASDNAYVPGAYSSSTPPGETKGVTDSGRDSEPPSTRSAAETSPTPVPEHAGPTEHLSGGSSSDQPWLTLLIVGVAVFVTSTALRFSISPRAG